MDTHLIRNERRVKIVEINGTRGFMPDFLLYMKDEDYTYQVFLETKGDHLREQDKIELRSKLYQFYDIIFTCNKAFIVVAHPFSKERG